MIASSAAHVLIEGDRRQDIKGRPVLTLETPAPSDSFQRALDSDQQALRAALETADHRVRERLLPLIGDLYAVLRSPIYPKKSCLSLADALVKTVLSGENYVHLYGVLANSTAVTEIGSILHCAALFEHYGFTPRVTLMLVRWENLSEIRHKTAASRTRSFRQHLRAVTDIAHRMGWPDAVIPVDVEVDTETGEILAPADFAGWSRRVLDASADPGHASPSLARDVAWSTGFYARQESLSHLGEQQALHDLAIRRAIGQRVAAEDLARPCGDDGVTALVTTELHKRFLTCYETSMPIVNLDTHAYASAASTSIAV